MYVVPKPPLPLSLSVSLLVCLLVACSPDEVVENVEQRQADSVKAAVEQQRKLRADSLLKRFPRITYQRLIVENTSVLDSIRRTFAKQASTMRNYRALTTLNRKDIYFVRLGDTLVVPDTIMDDLRAYSVFPQYYRAADTIPKLVLISNKWQSYACYEYGELVRFAAANTGEERKPTFPGRYAVNWKQRLRLSSLDSTWRLPFTVNFHQYAGSAFHQFEMPGRPVSHSCVRQFMDDAEWLFKWVKTAKIDTVQHRFVPFTGTPIIITDVFDFTRKRGGPWLELTSNAETPADLPADPMAVEEALIPISQIPKEARGALPDRKRYVEAESLLRDRGHIREGISLKESINFNKLRQEKRRRQAEALRKKQLETNGTN